MIEIKITKNIDQPLKNLWKITVTEFEKVGFWSTGIFKSWKTKDYDRVCETSFGKLYEKITLKDEKNHYIKIDVKGLPFFIKKFTGSWKFKKITDNKTEFTVTLNLQTMPIIGSIMGLIMKPKLQKAIEVTVKDYITYLETGKISKRKQREKDSRK